MVELSPSEWTPGRGGMIRIGIDSGGTKIEIAALDESDRAVARQGTVTPSGSYTDIFRTRAEA